MNSKNFAEWFRRQGYKVIQSESSCWYEVVPKTFQAFPYHQVIRPDEDELDELLKLHKGYSLRFSTPLNYPVGVISYHVIQHHGNYELSKLSKNARYDVRKGLDFAEVEQISLERLADEGWALQSDTLRRQGREDAQDRSRWEALCKSAIGLDGFEAWAAIHETQLVASAFCFIMDGTCSILYQQSRTEHLSNNTNNVLAYEITHEMMNRPNIDQVFYGLHSLDASSSVDAFKFRMGYESRPVRQRIFIRPPLSTLCNPATHASLKAAQKLFPNLSYLNKAEGMIRFYLQGKLPLAKQNWPEGVIDQKENILAGLGQ